MADTVPLADGRDVPKACVDALDALDERWPGATFPRARAAIAAAVLDAVSGQEAAPSVENDAPEVVEWVVALRMPPHRVGGLSLHQCSVCWALVVEDFMPDHERWHARVNPPAGKGQADA